MSSHVIKKIRFEKTSGSSSVKTCSLEQFGDGSVYVSGDELGELIVEFAPHSLRKVISQLRDLGYFPIDSIEDPHTTDD